MRPHRAEWNPVLRKIEAIVVTLNILIVLSKTCNQVSALALPPKASSHSRQQRQHQLHASAVKSACVLGSSSCACSYSAQTSSDSDLCSPGGGGLVVASGALIGVSPKERNLKSARNGAAGRSVILAMSDRSSSRMHVLGKVRGGGGGSVVRSSSSSTEVSASDTNDMDCEPAGQGPGQKGFVGTLLGVSEHDPQIRALALPALLSLLVDPILSLVDTAYVGRGLGAISLAALGPCTSIFHFSFNTFRSVTQSTTSLVSTSLAAGNKTKAGQIVQQMYVLAFMLGCLLMTGLYTQSSRVLAIMGAGPQTTLFPQASAYLTTRALAAPAVLIIMVSEGVFRGHADTRAPAVAALGAALANVVIDPIFMFVLGWGIAGAAGATALAQYLAIGIYGTLLWRGARAGKMAVPFFSRKRSATKSDADGGSSSGDGERVQPLQLLVSVVSANTAMLLRTTSLMACWSVATAVATRMSSVSVGAHQVALSLWLLFALVAEAPSIAAQVLGARYIGQGKLETARSMGWRISKLTLAVSGVMGSILMCFSGVFARFFTSDPAIVQRLRVLLPLLAIQQPLVSMTLVTEGLLVGAGQFRWLGVTTTLTSAVASWFLLELGKRAPGLDVVGIWGCITVMFIGRFTAAVARVMDRKKGPYWVARAPGKVS